MRTDTLLRRAEHAALRTIALSGMVLDLGGDTRSEYRTLFKGSPQFATVNLDKKTHPTLVHNLEEPLPISDATYDHALLINVLEHVFEYQQLLREAARVVRPGGSIVIVVPFLFPIHPSPSDFWRFSQQALRRDCASAGLQNVSVLPLGTGVFAARYVLLDRLLPASLRRIHFYTGRPIVHIADAIFIWLARAMRKSYDPADYALGYCITATV